MFYRTGQRKPEEAEAIMGNSFYLLVICGVILTVLGLALKRPMLYLFGASDATITFAEEYNYLFCWEAFL